VKRTSQFRVLESFATRLQEMDDELTKMTDAQLQVIITACSDCTQSNCWFQTFRVAPIVKRIAVEELERRRRAEQASMKKPKAAR
jgi:hypothetical protein